MKTSKNITVSLKVSTDTLERLDTLAGKAGLTRSKLLSNLVETSLETLEDCEKVGILQIGLLVRDLNDNMKDWAKKWREKKVTI